MREEFVDGRKVSAIFPGRFSAVIARIFGLAILSMLAGIGMMRTGSLANVYVESKNKGKMPVLVLSESTELWLGYGSDGRHCRLTKESHLIPLCDVIPIGLPSFGMMSPGDVAIETGASAVALSPVIALIGVICIYKRRIPRGGKKHGVHS